MIGRSKKCHKLSKVKKCNSNIPTSTVGKKPNEKTINIIVESRIRRIIDLECFFDLPLGFFINECNT